MCPTPVSERVEQMFDALPGLHDSPPALPPAPAWSAP